MSTEENLSSAQKLEKQENTEDKTVAQKLDRDKQYLRKDNDEGRNKNIQSENTIMKKNSIRLVGIALIVLGVYNFLSNGPFPTTVGTIGLGVLLLVSS